MVIAGTEQSLPVLLSYTTPYPLNAEQYRKKTRYLSYNYDQQMMDQLQSLQVAAGMLDEWNNAVKPAGEFHGARRRI